jgi:hypothetical protein
MTDGGAMFIKSEPENKEKGEKNQGIEKRFGRRKTPANLVELSDLMNSFSG